MSNSYTPAVAKAIAVARHFGGDVVATLIHQLWGDVAAIEKAAAVWENAAKDARQYIVDKVADDARTLGEDEWSGSAKDEYIAWVNGFHAQLQRLQDGIWQVYVQLLNAKNIVEVMHDDLEKMGQWFLGEIAAAGIRGKTPAGAATLAAISTWQLVQKLQDYHYSAKEKFRTAVTGLQTLRGQSETFMTPTPMTLPGPLPLPADVIRFGPAFPTRRVGDWHNWGHAGPGARQ